jgi:hypothetical protein
MPSRFISIYCSQCDEFILRYRKEGSGSLIRVYLNRISEPEHFKQFKHAREKSELPSLNCPQCSQRIGASMIHNTENRPAYRLVKGSFSKKEN